MCAALTLFRRRYSPPKSQQSTRICGQLHHESRALRRRRCGWLGAGDACPAGGARAADHRATPRRAVKASTTGFCSRAPVLRDWWRTCAVHQHCRAANLGHGSSRASWHAGCLGANSEHAQPPHQRCSRVLRVCAYRNGTLLPVLFVCVSSSGSESWYLGRSILDDNSV